MPGPSRPTPGSSRSAPAVRRSRGTRRGPRPPGWPVRRAARRATIVRPRDEHWPRPPGRAGPRRARPRSRPDPRRSARPARYPTTPRGRRAPPGSRTGARRRIRRYPGPRTGRQHPARHATTSRGLDRSARSPGGRPARRGRAAPRPQREAGPVGKTNTGPPPSSGRRRPVTTDTWGSPRRKASRAPMASSRPATTSARRCSRWPRRRRPSRPRRAGPARPVPRTGSRGTTGRGPPGPPASGPRAGSRRPHRPGTRGSRRKRRMRTARGLLEDDVRVGAAEAERVHARAGRPGGAGPGLQAARRSCSGRASRSTWGLGREKLRLAGIARWCRASAALIRPATPAAASRWPMFVFTEPRTQGRAGVAALGEHGAERGELDRIAERGAGAVGLDVIDLARGDAGVPVGRAQDRLLRLPAGGRQAVGPAVLVDRAAADHGVDRVAVGQGPGERLEDHDARALAADVAVGLRVEGLAAPVRREEPALRAARRRPGPGGAGSSRPPAPPRIRRPRGSGRRGGRPPATTSRPCRSPGSAPGSRRSARSGWPRCSPSCP